MTAWRYGSIEQYYVGSIMIGPQSFDCCNTPPVIWSNFRCLAPHSHLWMQGVFLPPHISPHRLYPFVPLHSAALSWPSCSCCCPLTRQLLPTQGFLSKVAYGNLLTEPDKDKPYMVSSWKVRTGAPCQQREQDGEGQFGQKVLGCMLWGVLLELYLFITFLNRSSTSQRESRQYITKYKNNI